MPYEYINFDLTIAADRWTRGGFFRGWRGIMADDPHWAPPPLPWLRRTLTGTRHVHIRRMAPTFLHVQAVRRRVNSRSDGDVGVGYGMSTSVFEETVGAAVLLTDPRVEDRTAYLALPHIVNDEACLDRLLESVMEQLWERGYRRLLAPIGLSPALGVGALLDYFNLTPPLHTPYNAPYVPELLAQSLEPIHAQQLFVATPPSHAQAAGGPATLVPATSTALSGPLLPLLQSACATALFPAPDAEEARFLADVIGQWPSTIWVAEMDGAPVGFVWLQGDYAPVLRRSHGGRNPLWRPWIAYQRTRPMRAGRLLLGGVLPAWRGQGIGRQLWHHALATSHAAGWETLTAGPVDVGSPGAAFLSAQGATPQQRYTLFAGEF